MALLFVIFEETSKPEQPCGNRISGYLSLLKTVPANSGERRTGPTYLLPAQSKPSCAQRYHCNALSWTPNSLILIKHVTRAIWHLLRSSNIKWKRNIYDQKQPFNSLLLPRFWNSPPPPFFLLITVPPRFTLPAAILQEIPRKKL